MQLFPTSSSGRERCNTCDSSVTVEMDGPWRTYRICVRNGHLQGDESLPPLGGALLYPARG